MNSKKEKKSFETNLAEIVNDKEKRDKHLLWGVIIDISEPFRYENRDDYVVKLKIIDDTFNFKAYIENREVKFHKFITIHIYAKYLNKCPKVKNVGDIIRLRRFYFNLNDKGEMLGYFNVYSNWLIYPGKNTKSIKQSCENDIAKNINRKLTEPEKHRLFELRRWSNRFFATNSVRNITWTSEIQEPSDDESITDNKYTCQNIDLILKTTKVQVKNKAIEFIDHRENHYALFLQAPPVIVKGNVIKLRCVNVIFTQEGRIITLTDNSSCLIVPPYFFDSKMFNKNANLMISHSVSPFKKIPKKSTKVTPQSKKDTQLLFPFLSEYEDTFVKPKKTNRRKKNGGVQSKKVTVVKSDYSNQKPSTIKQLFKVLDNPKDNLNKRFVVNGYILGFSQDKLAKIVKKMDTKSKKIYSFNQKVPKNRKKFIKYIYHFIIFMKDTSVEGCNKFLNVYVLTNEGEQHLFDLWELVPSSQDYAKWDKMKKTVQTSFEKKFRQLQDLENKVKLVVELLITKNGRPFFKLFDTIFLP